MKHPCPLSRDELVKYSHEHIRYELEMLFGLAEVLGRGQYISPTLVHNALVESFAIHLRNLIDFFFEPSTVKNSDIVASFYQTVPGCQGSITPSLQRARTKANKEVGHLTTDRHPEGSPKKVWQLGALTNELLQVAQKFAASADRNKLDKSVFDLIGLLSKRFSATLK